MPNILSYSSISKFSYCPTAWEFHYIKKIRPVRVSSALLFGGAIGKAFEQALITKDKEITISTFDQQWKEQEINKELVKLKNNKNIDYFKTDLDKDLGNTEWETLYTKGHLMIESFFTNFLPLVEKVFSTEEKVELRSGEDTSIGFADAVLKLKGYDKPIVMDFKTAGRMYDKNSVKESEQLSQYLHTLGEKYNTRLAGYAVFLKQINKHRTKICERCKYIGTGTGFKTCNNEIEGKRCNGKWEETINPSCTMQLIIDEIPQEFEYKVIDKIGEINDNINAGIIVSNFDACHNNYGRKCEYFNLCHNDSMEGLIKMEEKK